MNIKGDCLKAVPNRWLPGRRSILLRPFWPIRRVVATKSTTSSNHIYSTFIIYALFFFVKRNVVSESLAVSSIILNDCGNNRIIQPILIICGCQADDQIYIFSAKRYCFTDNSRFWVSLITKNVIRIFCNLLKIGIAAHEEFFSPPFYDMLFLIFRQNNNWRTDISSNNGVFFNIYTGDFFHTAASFYHIGGKCFPPQR